MGNLYAAQILNTLHKVFPNFDELLTQGNSAAILQWLQEHMYNVGGIYLPDDLMKRITGESLDPTYFTRYLTGKFESIYHLV
jgi:carboxypeptidase Taq